MSTLLGAFVVELALITYRDVTQGGIVVKKGQQSTAPIRAPLPSLYTSAIMIYGVLGIMPRSFDPLPGLVGWGLVVSTLLNLYTPGSANTAAAASGKMADQLTATTTPVKTKPATTPVTGSR